MKNIEVIANSILASKVTNLSSIKSDFLDIKRKTAELEKSITTFSGDDMSWEVIENWKPKSEEIIQIFESLMEKL